MLGAAESPILPETNEVLWVVVSAFALMIPVIVAAVLIRYIVTARRIAEAAARQVRGDDQPGEHRGGEGTAPP